MHRIRRREPAPRPAGQTLARLLDVDRAHRHLRDAMTLHRAAVPPAHAAAGHMLRAAALAPDDDLIAHWGPGVVGDPAALPPDLRELAGSLAARVPWVAGLPARG
ncbi:hypothetical protein [Streptomyces sp. RFCAC02]|uniref:hypothetical protein n=1 Tax=Streptomyces sp. RFCAC02 TaxID=2499143 RepID=UPI001F0DC368|nr:hypothetical protein [Streptomyces sp. RFCAC02]